MFIFLPIVNRCQSYITNREHCKIALFLRHVESTLQQCDPKCKTTEDVLSNFIFTANKRTLGTYYIEYGKQISQTT